MKTFVKLFGVVAGMAALLISCNKQENLPVPEAKTVEMTILASSDATKTVLGADGAVTWSTTTGEQLAVIEQSYVGEEATVAKATSKDGVTSDEGATMSFGVSLTAKTAESYNYYAVYPNSALVETPSDLAKAKIKLASTQYPTASSFGPAADILISKTVDGLTKQPTELKLQFARVIAVGKMTITNLKTTENVKKVTFTATGKPVTGRSHINLTNAAAVKYGYADQGVDNVVLDYSGNEISADGMTAYFTCWPFAIAAGESFSVVVETENYTFTRENITIPTAGKPLAFNAGRATAFNVSFTGIEGVKNAPVTQLVPNGEYVIAYSTNMMTVGTTSNQYRGVATLPEAANGSYPVEANAAWNFVYDSDTDTYSIQSVSESSYLNWTSSTNLTLNNTTPSKYSITKNEDGTYNIGSTSGSNTRYIGYNTQNPRFAMYLSGQTQQPINLNLYTAKVPKLAKITVQETLDLSADLAESSFPISWKNVDLSSSIVDVYKDEACINKAESWISVEFNEDKSAIKYTVLNNDTESERKAYIKVKAISVDGESEDSKVIVVTQATVVALTAYPYSESFAESQGDFTIDNVTMQSPLTYVWKHDTKGNYMKASAYVNKAYAAESWLISPVIDMSSAVNPVLSFMTVARHGSNENLTLWAREKGGDWTQLSFSNYGSGSDWTFVSNTVDVSAYVGKTLQFAYKYVSTSDGASTWEIKNVEVKEQGAVATLTSIAWTGYTTTYTVGDVFKEDGTVTATYSDGSTKDVTSEASFTTPDMSTAGTKTVTVTYEGATTTGDITVNEASTGGKTVLFTEGFGNNLNSARVWDDSFKEQGGIESVYSGSTYTITNAKQSKNSMGNTSSALVQTTTGTDAVFEVKSLNVSDYSDLTVSYFWKAGSTKKTYSTSLYYSIDNGVTYTKVEKDSGTGATSFVEVKYTLPAAAVSSNLCLKVIFNTSNTTAYIDDFVLEGNK